MFRLSNLSTSPVSLLIRHFLSFEIFASIFLIILSNVKYGHSWPEGTYGLPMPKTGCPLGYEIEWETGSRTQVTKPGSHASENNHLAGLESEPTSHVVQLFCMKMSYPRDGGEEDRWMPGKYCIFKKGECPANFHEGYILWDDAASYLYRDNLQTKKGVLPDGEFSHNTKIYYCCRTDGAAYLPIHAPTNAPFYLLKFGDICQEVEDMTVTEEWVYWADETRANINCQKGVYPRISRASRAHVYTRLYYCYYQPKPPSNTKKILLIILYTVAGLVGGLTILSFLICAIKAICHKRAKDDPDVDLEPLPQPRHLITKSSEPPMVYRYVSVRTSEDGGPTLVNDRPGYNHGNAQNNQGISMNGNTDGNSAAGNTNRIPVAGNGIGAGMGIPTAPPLDEMSEEGDEGERQVEIRRGGTRIGCIRTPSCVCPRCVSLPPPYSEVIDNDSRIV